MTTITSLYCTMLVLYRKASVQTNHLIVVERFINWHQVFFFLFLANSHTIIHREKMEEKNENKTNVLRLCQLDGKVPQDLVEVEKRRN